MRSPAPVQADDPETANDESNDQPLGHSGTMTLCATNASSGNSYPLDADVDEGQVETIYFQKGGRVHFSDCQLDSDLAGDCEDDSGNSWSFEGECG